MTAMVLAIMPSIVLFVFLQKYIVEGVIAGGGERLIVVLKIFSIKGKGDSVMRKKIVIVVLCLTVALVMLAGCGQSTKQPDAGEQDTNQPAVATSDNAEKRQKFICLSLCPSIRMQSMN